jgi:hypothetical protein
MRRERFCKAEQRLFLFEPLIVTRITGNRKGPIVCEKF